MTIGEMISQIHENAGEPSDLDPWVASPTLYGNADISLTSRGAHEYVKRISDAQITLANWKTNNNRPIRFHALQVQRNVKLTLDDQDEACTLSDGNDYITITQPIGTLGPHFFDGTLESSSVEVTTTHVGDDLQTVTTVYNQMAMFVEHIQNATDDVVTIYFKETIDLPRDSSDVLYPLVTTVAKFYFDRFKIARTGAIRDSAYMAMPTSFRNILKVTDADSASPLTLVHDKTALYNPELNQGTPSEYYVLGDVIYFDVYFEEPRWFVMEYQKLPDEIRITTSLPSLELPTEWHDVLIEVVGYNMAIRAQENELIAIKFSNINRLIARLRTDAQEQALREDMGNYQIEFSS